MPKTTDKSKKSINEAPKKKVVKSKLPPAKKGSNLKGTMGGYRPGAGMKKGYKLKRTVEKERALKQYQERIRKHADEIFEAQFSNAVGNILIYRIDEVGKGKNKKKVHTLIEDREEIKEVLDNGGGKIGEDYYIITVAKPDNYAISDMLDRAFGRPTQTVVTEDDEGKKQPIKYEIKIEGSKSKLLNDGKAD